MTRKELYNAIEARIRETVPDVKHIGLWNHNVEFIEDEQAWERPAVFVEFGQIDWVLLKDNSHRGTGKVRLHVVTDWSDDEPFALTDKIVEAVDGLDGEKFYGMTVLTTYTNHNHEELVESIEEFAVRYFRGAE